MDKLKQLSLPKHGPFGHLVGKTAKIIQMIKYIAYCRKSTDEKDKQVLSIEAQVEELEEFAKREKLEIIEFLAEAKTAKIPGRRRLAELLKDIENGKVNGILSRHPDRSARNSIDGGKIIYLLNTGKLRDKPNSIPIQEEK